MNEHAVKAGSLEQLRSAAKFETEEVFRYRDALASECLLLIDLAEGRSHPGRSTRIEDAQQEVCEILNLFIMAEQKLVGLCNAASNIFGEELGFESASVGHEGLAIAMDMLAQTNCPNKPWNFIDHAIASALVQAWQAIRYAEQRREHPIFRSMVNNRDISLDDQKN